MIASLGQFFLPYYCWIQQCYVPHFYGGYHTHHVGAAASASHTVFVSPISSTSYRPQSTSQVKGRQSSSSPSRRMYELHLEDGTVIPSIVCAYHTFSRRQKPQLPETIPLSAPTSSLTHRHNIRHNGQTIEGCRLFSQEISTVWVCSPFRFHWRYSPMTTFENDDFRMTVFVMTICRWLQWFPQPNHSLQQVPSNMDSLLQSSHSAIVIDWTLTKPNLSLLTMRAIRWLWHCRRATTLL